MPTPPLLQQAFDLVIYKANNIFKTSCDINQTRDIPSDKPQHIIFCENGIWMKRKVLPNQAISFNRSYYNQNVGLHYPNLTNPSVRRIVYSTKCKRSTMKPGEKDFYKIFDQYVFYF